MTHYKVEVIQKHIETYVVEADSKQEAEKLVQSFHCSLVVSLHDFFFFVS